VALPRNKSRKRPIPEAESDEEEEEDEVARPKKKSRKRRIPESDSDEEENKSDTGEEENKSVDHFAGMSASDLLPLFSAEEHSVHKGELVVVTGIEGGAPYHVAQVEADWPNAASPHYLEGKIPMSYYGYRQNYGYAPSWSKSGEDSEKIQVSKPNKRYRRKNVNILAEHILLSNITLQKGASSERELSLQVQFTLRDWVSSLDLQ
jgi:hypothetical protein